MSNLSSLEPVESKVLKRTRTQRAPKVPKNTIQDLINYTVKTIKQFQAGREYEVVKEFNALRPDLKIGTKRYAYHFAFYFAHNLEFFQHLETEIKQMTEEYEAKIV